MTKFKIGDKVVPIDKTALGSLEYSTVWNRAKISNQPFIYVTALESEEGDYICDDKKGTDDGDFFNESDLIPYADENETVNNKVKLTQEQAVIIESFKNSPNSIEDVIAHHLNSRWIVEENACLNSLAALDFIDALRVGYEVEIEEEKYNVNDWVIRNNGKLNEGIQRTLGYTFQIVKVRAEGVIDNNDVYHSFDNIQLATLEEIKHEKELQFWKLIGRKFAEFKLGDIYVDYDGIRFTIEDETDIDSRCISIATAKEWYDESDFIGLHLVESLVKFDNE